MNQCSAAHRSSLAASSFSFESMARVLMAGVSCRPPAEFEPFRDESKFPNASVFLASECEVGILWFLATSCCWIGKPLVRTQIYN